MEQHQGPEVWHRLGDLATYVLALDIHREQANSSAPFFLGETRRRTFTRAYQLDKHIATLLNRPPRLSRHYSTCKMPLDLSDAAIFEENSERLEASRQGLTNEGWDSGGQYSSSSWIRLRYLVAVLADQMLECHFCLPASDHKVSVTRMPSIPITDTTGKESLEAVSGYVGVFTWSPSVHPRMLVLWSSCYCVLYAHGHPPIIPT